VGLGNGIWLVTGMFICRQEMLPGKCVPFNAVMILFIIPIIFFQFHAFPYSMSRLNCSKIIDILRKAVGLHG
jgi:hypothetical protein